MTATSAARSRSAANVKHVRKVKPRSLSAGVRSGALWNVASTLMLRLAGILVTAIVAHILDPHDFGVFAVATTAYAIVSSLGELGVSSCLVRADLDIDALAPTMASVSLSTSACLAGAMIIFARPIASALGSADAVGPVRVMAITVILVGIFAVPTAQFMRDFRQDKLFLANAISFIPSTAILLLLAKFGSGAMAFAWSRAAGQLAAGCVLLAYLPKFYWPGIARSALSVLYKFGIPLAIANFVNYILVNVDYALVGHLMGAIMLGIYVLAFNVASWSTALLSSVINSVSVPAFSRVKNDPNLLAHSIVSSVRAVSLIAMPMCGLVVALARPLVLVLYGARWSAAANVLPILAFYGVISIICILFANMLVSMGRSKILLVVQLVWLAALVPAMALGVRRDGIAGAAIAHIFVIAPIVLPCYLFALKRATGVRFFLIAKAIVPPLLASAVAALAARAVASQFPNPLAQLVAGLVVGGLTYLAAVAPQATVLLSKEQAASRQVKRIIHTYQYMGLPIGHQPKHAARRKPPVRVARIVAEAEINDNHRDSLI
jgi:lipopolysaccharide exporter